MKKPTLKFENEQDKEKCWFPPADGKALNEKKAQLLRDILVTEKIQNPSQIMEAICERFTDAEILAMATLKVISDAERIQMKGLMQMMERANKKGKDDGDLNSPSMYI